MGWNESSLVHAHVLSISLRKYLVTDVLRWLDAYKV